MPSAANPAPYKVLCAAAKARRLRVVLTVDGPPERTRLDTLELWEGGPRKKGTMVARVAVLGRSLDEAADALLDEMRAA